MRYMPPNLAIMALVASAIDWPGAGAGAACCFGAGAFLGSSATSGAACCFAAAAFLRSSATSLGGCMLSLAKRLLPLAASLLQHTVQWTPVLRLFGGKCLLQLLQFT